MSYEKLQNETEILSADERKLREMCRTLKKIEAPKDFDFRLKARIAGAKPADLQPRFAVALRYALPALALILVFGLLAYNGGFLSSKVNQPVVQSPLVPQDPELPQNNAVPSVAPPETAKQPDAAVSNSDLQKTFKNTRPQVAGLQNPKKNLPKDETNSSTNSRDFSLTKDEQVNFNGVIPRSPSNIEQSKPMPIKEVLLINGINAVLENGKWTVKSVTPNGVGESSGVQANDIIEAIDDQPLSAETVFNKTVKGQTITVTRKGVKSQINLRNKQ